MEGQAVLSVPAIAAQRRGLGGAAGGGRGQGLRGGARRARLESRRAAEGFHRRAGEIAAVVRVLQERHFSGYEPFYFIAGPDYPTARFQISFKYRLFSDTGPLAKRFPPSRASHIAYTQTSLWDLDSTSKPFVDTSYKPEALLRGGAGGRRPLGGLAAPGSPGGFPA